MNDATRPPDELVAGVRRRLGDLGLPADDDDVAAITQMVAANQALARELDAG